MNLLRTYLSIALLALVFSCRADPAPAWDWWDRIWEDEATLVNDNLTAAADNFEIFRRIVFYNVWEDKIFQVIEGRCSITDQGHQFEVLCKTGSNQFVKHFLGKTTNVTYTVVQLESVYADPYHMRITFRPSTVIPDLDIRTGGAGASLATNGSEQNSNEPKGTGMPQMGK